MKVFVAGASGVIGRTLVGMLVRDGHEVTGTTRKPDRADSLRQLGATPVICDVLNSDAVSRAVADAKPEAVIHELTDLPPRLEPRKYKQQLIGTNRLRRDGTRNLIAAAQAAGVERLVAQSIAFAYAPTGDWVKDEDAPLALDAPPPMDAAIAAIADLERQVLDAGGIVLRYGFFYGPGTQFASDAFYAEQVRKRRLPVIGGGEGRWSFIHIQDAASATVAALTDGSPGIYNIVDDDPAPAHDWIDAYATAMDAKRPLRLPKWIGRLAGGTAAVAGMTTQRAASNAKAKRELGGRGGWVLQHPSWRDGFRTAAG